MKISFLFVIFLFACLASDAQTVYLTRKNSCMFLCRTTPVMKIRTTADTVEAREIVTSILAKVSLPFKINILTTDQLGNNMASALIDSDLVKCIVIDKIALGRLNRIYNNDWGTIFILAHECAHQLSGTNLAKLEGRLEDERKADEFAGSVLYKLHATLPETLQALDAIIQSDCQDHASKKVRLTDAEAGWRQAEKDYRFNAQPEIKNTDMLKTKDRVFTIANNLSIAIKKNPIDYDPSWNFINQAVPMDFVVDNRIAPLSTGGKQTYNVQMAGYQGKAVVGFNPFVTCQCIADVKIPAQAMITEQPQTFDLVNFRKYADNGKIVGGQCMGLNNMFFAGGWAGKVTLATDVQGNITVRLVFEAYASNHSLSYRYMTNQLTVPVNYTKN